MSDKKTGLSLLREPFPVNQISKLPKPTKQQTDAVRADFKIGIRCALCGAWHHKDVVHLDYVGHAALTDRLLDCDPLWSWEPLSLKDGLPNYDDIGGLWIKLTVCGHSVIGYGHAGDKKGGDAIKEIIGDALRNAAMRLGAALDLWHKGDLHVDDDPENKQDDTLGLIELHTTALVNSKTVAELKEAWIMVPKHIQAAVTPTKAKRYRELTQGEQK